MAGTLYVVATPIGNLEDITMRAVRILSEVDVIAAEDTRRSRKLLNHYNIGNGVISYFKFNEAMRTTNLLNQLLAGSNIALISDAGTPSISDPGHRLIETAIEAGVSVVPIPGASALTCALSVSAVDTRRFVFEGFLPPKGSIRTTRLNELMRESRAIVLFEAPHRIVQTLADLAGKFGADRRAGLFREMTKIHETILFGSLGELTAQVTDNSVNRKGEFVVVVAGTDSVQSDHPIDDTLNLLLKELPIRKATQVAAELLGVPRNKLYKRSLELKGSDLEQS